MKFALTDEQAGYARSLDNYLAQADVALAVRTWADGDSAAGRAIWAQLAGLGVTSLALPDSGAELSDVVVAFEQLGHHLTPGPWAESAVLLPTLLGAAAEPLAEQIATVGLPLALDADVADQVFVLDAEGLHVAQVGAYRASIDPARRLFDVTAGELFLPAAEFAQPASVAIDWASLASAAQLLGAGYRVLEDTVEYTKSRIQFGQPIGKFQAVKHLLADAKVALDFARPLVWGAALTPSPRDISAAKVAAGEAAYQASRAALQAHGAIGYTKEYDLGLWLLRIKALRSAYGSPSYHRGRVLSALTQERG